METEVKKVESAATPKKRGGFFKFIFILLIIGGMVFAGWHFDVVEKVKNEFLPPKNIFVNQDTLIDYAESPNIQANSIAENQPRNTNQLEVMPSLLPPLLIESEAAIAPEPAQPQAPSPETLELKQKTEDLSKSNRAIVLYMAVRDLKESISNPDRFSHELAFVKAQALEYPELGGKIQILEIIDNQGLPTKTAVEEDLIKLQENLRNKSSNSFMQNIKSSLSRLVTVSKIEGEVAVNDYNSIIKRTQIALKENNLKKAQAEISKLGTEGAIIADKIKSIINTQEVIDDLIDNLKTKLIN